MSKDAYPVGYKRPPQRSQFKKGASGNPKGRPRHDNHDEDVNAMLLREAERLITVRDHTGVHQMSVKNAAIRALLESALKGNVHAQKHFLSRIEIAEQQRADERAKIAEGWKN